MCIPIELDVPVVTIDGQEIGIAREILCPCPGDLAGVPAAVAAHDAESHGSNDLWLRVTRAARSDLYVPFGEIAETRADGVQLRITEDELAGHAWDRLPLRVPVLV
jgi:hypothetical protein